MHAYICSYFTFLSADIILIHDNYKYDLYIKRYNTTNQFFFSFFEENWIGQCLAEASDIPRFARAISRNKMSLINVFLGNSQPPHWSWNRRRRRSSDAFFRRAEAKQGKVENKARSVPFDIFSRATTRRFVLIHPRYGFLFLRRVFSLHEGGTQFHLGRGKE